MAGQLEGLGYGMTDEPSEASLIVVNTCGFLQSAVEEAIETVLRAAEHKSLGACETLVVAGCMVQRYGRKLLELLPEADVLLGVSHTLELRRALDARRRGESRRLWIGRPLGLPDATVPRLLPSPPYSTYLKIADGCSNRCAYCMIPRLRGPYRSRSVDDVLREAAELVARGAVELNVVAQDTTAFGRDRGQEGALAALIEGLEAFRSLRWVRILYAYPEKVDARLLTAMRASSKVVPYLDMPIQHCAPGILHAMGRNGSRGSLGETIALVRRHLPDAALRTSVMVGFPGETEADFKALLDFIREVEFDHLGVFAFSPERGSRAARFADQVDEAVKEERREALLAAQRDISRRRLSRFVGKELDVLIEGLHPETNLLLQGRTAYQAPEVDGTVLITEGVGSPGEIHRAQITGSHDYDLVARLIHASDPGRSPRRNGGLPQGLARETL